MKALACAIIVLAGSIAFSLGMIHAGPRTDNATIVAWVGAILMLYGMLIFVFAVRETPNK